MNLRKIAGYCVGFTGLSIFYYGALGWEINTTCIGVVIMICGLALLSPKTKEKNTDVI